MLESCLICSQVLIGFVATGYLTLLLVLAYYILGFVEAQFLNPIDRGCLRYVRRIIKPRSTTRRASTLRKAVLMYSDQQLVTGIALLIGGFSQLHYGLDAYHWQILVYLVWFSSLTHLTTLTVLRQYFRENPALRLWRAGFMLVTVIMLGIALVPTGNSLWLPVVLYDSKWTLAGIPVLCYYESDAPPYVAHGRGRGPSSAMTVSVLVLFFGYLTRLVKLSSKAAAFNKHYLRTAPGMTWKRWLARCGSVNRPGAKYLLLKVVYIIMETIYICLHGWYEVYDSILWEVSFWKCNDMF